MRFNKVLIFVLFAFVCFNCEDLSVTSVPPGSGGTAIGGGSGPIGGGLIPIGNLDMSAMLLSHQEW